MNLRMFWWLVRRSLISTFNDGCIGAAKGAAYSALLSFFPLLTSAAAIMVQTRTEFVASTLEGFLRQIVPFGIAATSNLYGIEGFHLKDVLGVIAVAQPAAITSKPMHMDVETRGELTRGMTVFDQRHWLHATPNIDLATDVDIKAVREYIVRVLRLNE